MTHAIETLEKLGYTLAVLEDGNISVRGRPSSQAEAALSVLRADKAKAALCLRQMEDFKRVKHAFRVAFDFFQAHFPPTMEDAYWLRTAEDLGTACAALDSDPLGVDLLVAACIRLEEIAAKEEKNVDFDADGTAEQSGVSAFSGSREGTA